MYTYHTYHKEHHEEMLEECIKRLRTILSQYREAGGAIPIDIGTMTKLVGGIVRRTIEVVYGVKFKYRWTGLILGMGRRPSNAKITIGISKGLRAISKRIALAHELGHLLISYLTDEDGFERCSLNRVCLSFHDEMAEMAGGILLCPFGHIQGEGLIGPHNFLGVLSKAQIKDLADFFQVPAYTVRKQASVYGRIKGLAIY